MRLTAARPPGRATTLLLLLAAAVAACNADAREHGWLVVSMRKDFKVVFP